MKSAVLYAVAAAGLAAAQAGLEGQPACAVSFPLTFPTFPSDVLANYLIPSSHSPYTNSHSTLDH